ncbi:hypothetical protein GGX14DRAFT_630780 [Mycena pura]|uniref:Uncharacterized protein n=1 Tax=Mycena pura TaxID=153505 RepID=A0AAD6YH28_9AGAR|nr:hypothetical protein GGX14DRAFT_630780 [Mycena pura]
MASYYRQNVPGWGTNQLQFSQPPAPTFQPQPNWGGMDFYNAHAVNPNSSIFDHAMNRVRQYSDDALDQGVGVHEAKHWHRRAYGGTGDMGLMLPAELGHAAAYEAYRTWIHNSSIHEPLSGDVERQREGLIGLAVAEASRLLQFAKRSMDSYASIAASDAAAATASIIFYHYRDKEDGENHSSRARSRGSLYDDPYAADHHSRGSVYDDPYAADHRSRGSSYDDPYAADHRSRSRTRESSSGFYDDPYAADLRALSSIFPRHRSRSRHRSLSRSSPVMFPGTSVAGSMSATTPSGATSGYTAGGASYGAQYPTGGPMQIAGQNSPYHSTVGMPMATSQTYGSMPMSQSYGSMSMDQSRGSMPMGQSYGSMPLSQSYSGSSMPYNYGNQSYGAAPMPVGQSYMAPTVMSTNSRPRSLSTSMPGYSSGQYGAQVQYASSAPIRAPEAPSSPPEQEEQTVKEH